MGICYYVRHGVSAEIITATWGLESFYGKRRGDVPVISATSTLAFDGRSGRFFEPQLVTALRIVQDGDIPAGRMTGRWAGGDRIGGAGQLRGGFPPDAHGLPDVDWITLQ